MIYKITKGTHSPFRIPKLHWKKALMNFEAKFTESCELESDHINKLCGFSYGWHWKNSIRIGWKFNPENQMFELYRYTYENGNRNWTFICFVDTAFSGSIEIDEDKIEIQIMSLSGKRILGTDAFITTMKPSWGYILFPYWGGKQKAPENIELALKFT